MGTCNFCMPNDTNTCSAVHPTEHWNCTRDTGHSGSHVACGTDSHNIAQWSDEEQKAVGGSTEDAS